MNNPDFVRNTRSAPRFRIALFLCASANQEPIGRTRDISLSGMFFLTANVPPVGSTIAVDFVWGEELYGLTGRVVRRDPDGVALQFDMLDASSEIALRDVLGSQARPNS